MFIKGCLTFLPDASSFIVKASTFKCKSIFWQPKILSFDWTQKEGALDSNPPLQNYLPM